MEEVIAFDLSRYRDLDEINSENPWISQRDRWRPTDPAAKDIWHLDGFLPGYGSMTIGWDFDAPEGMLDVFKLVAVTLFTGDQSRYSHRTANIFAQSVKYFAGFMLAKDYASLGELDEVAFERFRTTLARTISRPSENAEVFIETLREQESHASGPDEDDDVAHEGGNGAEVPPEDRGEQHRDGEGETDDLEGDDLASDGDPPLEKYGEEHGAVGQDDAANDLTVAIVANRLYLWYFLREAREALAALGIAPPHDPFANVSMRSVIQNVTAKGLDDVEPLPDAVAIPILNAAATLLGTPADDVVRLQAEFLAIQNDTGAGLKTRLRRQRELARAFRFSSLVEGGAPWREPLKLRSAKSIGSIDLRREIRRIHMAALTMILAGTGMRISEACSLEVDDRDIDDGLPSCVVSRPSLTEQTEHFFLQGLLSKGRPKPVPEEWLLGARPQKAHAEPATLRAVRVLESLLQPWRRMAPTPELRRQLQVSLFGTGLPKRGQAIRWIRGTTLAKLMAEFFASLDLRAVLAEAVTQDERLRVYADTNGRCIHPHQWRHTYYEFMVRLDPGLLPAVSLHFKHTTLAATELGYGSKDASVREAKDSVRVRETVRSFTRRRFGEVAPVGNMARELERERAALERMVGDLPGDAAEERVERFVIENDIRIWPAEHGSCLMGLNPAKAACRQAAGSVDFRTNAPDVANRTPSLCCGCPNFSVGKEHIPFWRRRYVENRTAWIESDRNPLFRVALRQAEQAAAMLRALGEPVPLILRKPIRREPAPPAAASPADSAEPRDTS